MQIENVNVEALVAYERNAKTHPPEQLAQLVASIEAFGFTSPILVGGNNVIIAGHGRLAAAKQAGLTEVPIIRLGHLTETQQRALVIADNKIAENGGWDEALLADELRALDDLNFDLELLAFDETELSALMQEDLAGEADPALPGDPDHIPEPEVEAITRPGDVWELGAHRLICGDSTEAHVLSKLCGNASVDLVWTDPPYNVNYSSGAGSIKNDNLSASDFGALLEAALQSAEQVMRPGAAIYVAHADTEGFTFRAAFAAAGFKLSGCLVWVKPTLVLGRSDYQWRHEPILYGWKLGAAHDWFGGRAQTTVLESETSPVRIQEDKSLHIDIGDETLVITGKNLSVQSLEGSVLRCAKPARNADHPTMKPVSLVQRMVENSSEPGAVVLDIFAGSGSTLIACETAGRRGRGVELDPKFCDVIVRRWQEFTGREARLAGSGVSFAEACERAAA